jgi:hypothetical protein
LEEDGALSNAPGVCLVCTHDFVGADQSVPNEHFSWHKINVSNCGKDLGGGVTKKDAKQRKGEARGKLDHVK